MLGEEVPSDVTAAVKAASTLIWADSEAAANKIRIAVEHFLNERKVPKSTINKKRKRQSLSLHTRIEKYKAKNKDLANHLMALKWIGNNGSHTAALKRKDVLDGFQILHHIIDEAYYKTRIKLTELSKDIIKRKGRPKVRRKLKPLSRTSRKRSV
ncbi:DUF4145 domain-containing protein [Siccirubricoccus deserti]